MLRHRGPEVGMEGNVPEIDHVPLASLSARIVVAST